MLPSTKLSSEELPELNQRLESMSAVQRIEWSLKNLPGKHVISSSFGIQSAVSLHMMNQVNPGIPVILVDTGHLFPETYRFIDELVQTLNLNLHVYQAELSAAWQEARFGKLWEQGSEGLGRYNQLNKTQPMQRALQKLEVTTWFAGLRRQQSDSRADLPVLRLQEERYKVHPIIDWSRRDVHEYLKQHDLPYHPLWEKGYVSVGDVETSRPLKLGMSEQESRFFGLQRECGLHT